MTEKQSYLYSSPEGVIKLIERDKMPPKPDRESFQIWPYSTSPYDELGYSVAMHNYAEAIQAAKASAIPIQDQDRANDFLTRSGFVKVSDTIYGPFTVEYRKQGVCCSPIPPNINHHGYCDECDRYTEVAILYDDTPEKEPNFTDGAFIEKLDQASPLLGKVADIYAQTNYSGFDHSIAVAKYSFIRGFNFAKHQREPEIQDLRDKLRDAQKSHTEEESQVSKLKLALQDKIKQFEAYKTDPRYQTEMEQNAVVVTLRELRYLDSIAEYE